MVDSHATTGLEILFVDVRGLRRRGIACHQIDAELPGPWLRLAFAEMDVVIDHPGRITCELRLLPNGAVIASGTFRMRLAVPCGRCLELADLSHSAAFDATFVTRDPVLDQEDLWGNPEDEEGGVALKSGDLDTWIFDGAVLDLSLALTEHAQLAYPMRALCGRGEQCRGLCRQCGQDLNHVPEGDCPRCEERSGGEKWEDETPWTAAIRKLGRPD